MSVTPPNVAFCRPLVPGLTGDDVVAHKRAISRWDPAVYPWTQFTPFYGPHFKTAVEEFQRRNASEITQATGRIGKTTHEVLERKHRRDSGEWAFDTLAISLAKGFCDDYVKTPEEKVREAILAAGFYWYSHRAQIAYSQYRPYALGKPPWVPSRWDCSGFVTVCHYAGGAPDPNGRGYDQQGYTGTLMTRGARVGSISSLEPGDLIFYGFSASRPGFNAGDPTHVALYVGVRDGAPMVLSHGSYPMKYLHFDYRRINHLRHYPMGV